MYKASIVFIIISVNLFAQDSLRMQDINILQEFSSQLSEAKSEGKTIKAERIEREFDQKLRKLFSIGKTYSNTSFPLFWNNSNDNTLSCGYLGNLSIYFEYSRKDKNATKDEIIEKIQDNPDKNIYLTFQIVPTTNLFLKGATNSGASELIHVYIRILSINRISEKE
jgi:hypothetical protein